MSATLDAAREQVGRFLASAGVPAEPDGNGGFTLPHGPTTVFVAISETDGPVLIEVWAPVLADVALTPNLFRSAAETSFLFGRLCVARTGDATGQLQLSQALAADPLTEAVLIQVLGTVANTAADLATTLPATFPPPTR